jgi:hypothetical protein
VLPLHLLPLQPVGHLAQKAFGGEVQPVTVVEMRLLALGFFYRA